MNRPNVHLCMVSAQPLPNLIPALDPATRPETVILLTSEDMRSQAIRLYDNFKKLGCQVENVSIHPYRIDEIRATIIDLLVRYQGQHVWLNATCGTKLMALGAYDIFREFGHPVFYIDTDNQQQITLLPEPATAPLADLVTVKCSLAAYGYSMTSTGDCRVLPERRQFGEYLVNNVERLSGALGGLNALAARAKKTLQAQLDPRRPSNQPLQDLLARTAAAGILVIDGDRLTFKDENSRFFANGGWLEEYLTQTVNRLKGEKLIRDHKNNLTITSGGRVKNEIDLAFTANNRLHLLECKTGKLSEKEGRENRADGIAYKLEALRDLVGGTYARAMLISYRKLTAEDRQRCREYRIEVIEGMALKQLCAHLKRWIAAR